MRHLLALRILFLAAIFLAAIPHLVLGQASNWEEKTISELTFESPLPVTLIPGIADEVKNKSDFASLRAWMAISEPQNFAIGIVRMEGKPDVSLTVDGAIEGGMKKALKSMGVDDPKFSIEVIKVSGLEARRAKFRRDSNLNVESVVIINKQLVYQVQIIYPDSKAEDAKRVLNSIQVTKE